MDEGQEDHGLIGPQFYGRRTTDVFGIGSRFYGRRKTAVFGDGPRFCGRQTTYPLTSNSCHLTSLNPPTLPPLSSPHLLRYAANHIDWNIRDYALLLHQQ